jgi:hypothetical protein
MIKLKQISETYQDCTADYDVIIDNEKCTVIEFIHIIINERKYEYGYIKVLDYKIKYDNGILADNPIKIFGNDILNKTIFDVSAYGGYGFMNYEIVI